MPEDQAPAALEAGNDQTENLKKEFARKMQKVQEQNDALNGKLDTIMNHLAQAKTAPSQVVDEQALEDLKYSDPDKYVQIKMGQLEQQVDNRVNQAIQQQTGKNQTVQQLVADYPELSQPSSDMYKKVMEYAGKYDPEFMKTPEGIRLVAREAAADLGIIPASKRTKQNEEFSVDDFIAGGGGGSGDGGKKSKKDDDKALDPRTVATAQLMGLNIDDPEVVKRLKKHSKRKSWTKWE